MGIVRPGIAGLLCMLVIALAASAYGRSDRHPDRRAERTEALFGAYNCGAGLGEGYTWIGGEATGDVLPRDLFITRRIGVEGSPAASCDALSAGAIALAQDRGCVTGPIEARDHEDGGASRDFHFICHAERDVLVETLAELGSYVLAAAP